MRVKRAIRWEDSRDDPRGVATRAGKTIRSLADLAFRLSYLLHLGQIDAHGLC